MKKIQISSWRKTGEKVFVKMFSRIKNIWRFLCNNVFNIYTLSQKIYLELNSTYENNDGLAPVVKNRYETLTELLDGKKSISRFGDGEFNLILGDDIAFQKNTKELQRRLKEVLTTDDHRILIGIPNVFSSLDGFTKVAASFWRWLLLQKRAYIYDFLDMDKIYYDALISRPYMDFSDKNYAVRYFEKLKSLWRDKDVVFVEGEMSRLGCGNDLFYNCKSIKRIICPTLNAFDKYDDILQECLSMPENSFFILALGPTASVLAYDLTKNNFRALDMGHVDIEYEWMVRGCRRKKAVKNKYVNESRKGRVFSDFKEEYYHSQIIKRIK